MTVSVCTADVSPQTQIYTLEEQQQRFWNAAALLWVPHRVCVIVCARVLGWSKSDLQTKMGLCGKMTASYPPC